MKSSWRPSTWLRALRWHRRAVGVTAILMCLMTSAAVVLAPPPQGSTVVVTTRALPPGTVLTDGDVRTALAPDALVPAGAVTTVAGAIGATLAVAQPAGAIVTDLALGDSAGALADAAVGEVLVPLRLADPDIATLLRVGTIVTVVASSPEGGTSIVAEHVRIAILPARTDGTGLFGTTGATSSLVVVAAGPQAAQRLATAYGSALGVILE